LTASLIKEAGYCVILFIMSKELRGERNLVGEPASFLGAFPRSMAGLTYASVDCLQMSLKEVAIFFRVVEVCFSISSSIF